MSEVRSVEYEMRRRISAAIQSPLDQYIIALGRWGKETNTPKECLEAEQAIIDAIINVAVPK